ncbi:hypothetical protein V6N13_037986 [Hibiscus sabdariffa]
MCSNKLSTICIAERMRKKKESDGFRFYVEGDCCVCSYVDGDAEVQVLHISLDGYVMLRLAFGALFMDACQPRLNYINADVCRMHRYCAFCARLLQKLQIICSAMLSWWCIAKWPEEGVTDTTSAEILATKEASLLFVKSSWVKKYKLVIETGSKLAADWLARDTSLLFREEAGLDQAKLFSSEELEAATDHYNANRILSRGGQCLVYKRRLPDGRIVAVNKSNTINEGSVFGSHELAWECLVGMPLGSGAEGPWFISMSALLHSPPNFLWGSTIVVPAA